MDKGKADLEIALEALTQAKALKSPRTLEWYRMNVGALRAWLVDTGQATRLGDVSAEVVQAFLAGEETRAYRRASRLRNNAETGTPEAYTVELPGKLSEHSLNSKIRCLRAFGRWLVKSGWLKGPNPFEGLELAGAPKLRKKVLSEDEINGLFQLLNDQTDTGARDRAILWLFLDTGIRLSELATLTLSSVNLKDRDDGPWIQVIGKDRKERRIGLCPGGRRALQHYVELFRPDWVPFGPERAREVAAKGVPILDDPLFLTVEVHGLDRRGGEQLLPNAIQLIVGRLGKKAGIKGLSPHAFRRTFATQNLELGASPLDVMRDLGHSSLTMTNYYASLADQNRMRRHRQFSYMERLSRPTKPEPIRKGREAPAARATAKLSDKQRRAS